MAGLMDMFKTKPAPTGEAATTVAGNNGNQPAPNAGTDTNKKADPKENLNKPENQENPLDIYTKVFDNANKGEVITAPSFKLDPTKIKEVAGKMDFTKGLNPELLQKATTGDASAMLELIKTVGQNSYAASIEHLTSLTDSHLNSRADYERTSIDRGVKQQLTTSALSSAPNFNHPAVKRALTETAERFSASKEFADATPQEIADAARKYISDLAGALNPADPNKTADGKDKVKSTNWDAYFKQDSGS